MIVGFFVCLILLIAIAAVVVPSGNLGRFERERRRDQKGIEVMRELYQAEALSLQRGLVALLLVAMASFAIASFGWVWGIVAACVVALSYGRIASAKSLRHFSRRLYFKYEHQLLQFIETNTRLIGYIRSYVPEAGELHVHSREELVYLLETTSTHVLSESERQMLLSSLEFGTKTAHDVMTQRAAIVSVKKHEILGPLVLDDLHKSGHSHFPVIDGDLDTIVGILYINDYLTLDTTRKHTLRADSAMGSHVTYVDEREPLEKILETMISSHQHLVIVTGSNGMTVGLVTLKDIVTTLVGRQL